MAASPRITIRKIIVGIGGGLLILIGVLLLVLPGPGIAVIVLGFAVLSSEFPWADKYFQKIKHKSAQKLPFFKRK